LWFVKYVNKCMYKIKRIVGTILRIFPKARSLDLAWRLEYIPY
jgi:hypothetical protein